MSTNSYFHLPPCPRCAALENELVLCEKENHKLREEIEKLEDALVAQRPLGY